VSGCFCRLTSLSTYTWQVSYETIALFFKNELLWSEDALVARADIGDCLAVVDTVLLLLLLLALSLRFSLNATLQAFGGCDSWPFVAQEGAFGGDDDDGFSRTLVPAKMSALFVYLTFKNNVIVDSVSAHIDIESLHVDAVTIAASPSTPSRWRKHRKFVPQVSFILLLCLLS